MTLRTSIAYFFSNFTGVNFNYVCLFQLNLAVESCPVFAVGNVTKPVPACIQVLMLLSFGSLYEMVK